MVTVHHPKAPGGRIRKQCNGTRSTAQALETEIERALSTYGMWPVAPGAEPLTDSEKSPQRLKGTLSHATQLALDTQWKGTVWGESVAAVIWGVVRFFEARKRFDLDDIRSEDIDAFVASKRAKGTSTTMIKKYFSMLSVINTVAFERDPKLATRERLPLPRLRAAPIEKWWLRPEGLEAALEWLIEIKADQLFADYISMLVLQGLRPGEALRLEPRHFTGLGTDTPSLQVPGTKTRLSGNTIPVFEDALELVKRCIERAKVNRTSRLFPYTWRQASDRWNEVRALLGVEDVQTATLRSLRRTFAYYAHRRHLSTRLVQQILRHETITTTQGYLEVVGSDDVELAREKMNASRPKGVDNREGLGDAIKAAVAAGMGPKEVAELIKELTR